MWTLMEGVPRVLLLGSIIAGALYIASLNTKTVFSWFKFVPWVLGVIFFLLVGFGLSLKPDTKEHSRLAITSIEVVPADKGNLGFPYINVYFTNHGSISLSGYAYSTHSFDTDAVLNQEQANRLQDDVLARLKGNELNQIEVYPHDPIRLFTVPDRKGPDADIFTKTIKDVLERRAALYFLVAFRYRDRNMPKGVSGITEACSAWGSDLVMRHDCGRNRSFIDDTSVARFEGMALVSKSRWFLGYLLWLFPEWLQHLEHFLVRLSRTLLSWSGFGIAALVVTAVTFLANLYSQSKASALKRYASPSRMQVMKEFGVVIRPTISSVPTLITLAAWLIVFLVAVAVTVYRDHEALVGESGSLVIQVKQLQEENKKLTDAKKPAVSKVWDRPPLRIETYGFGTVLPPRLGPLTQEEQKVAKWVGPNGTFEHMSLIQFRIHILNISTKHHVSLLFRMFRIDWPPPKASYISSDRGMQLGDGIRRNLGPEEDTEGLITVPVITSLYLANGDAGKMTLTIHDAVSNADATVKIN